MPTDIQKADYALVIHGGAGTILKKNMSAEKEAAIRQIMNEALDAGEAVLKAGGSSLDAVTQTIVILENSPYFNAGKGAVFTHEGKNELDASIMTGQDQNAGAVGGITKVKNPILAARAVLENSPHVFLSGAGADEFAGEQGLETVPAEYFHTDRRWKSLQNAKAKEEEKGKKMGYYLSEDPDHKFGTVGAVALDKKGNITAGTSTGGMTNKRYHRIGDSPVIGAGTYADNASCGVSSTGHGEFFIRYAVAHDIHARMLYKGVSLEQAADEVVMDVLKSKGGSGGVIALDGYGNVAMPFNTAGMYRGYTKAGGERKIAIYQEEE
ncbi:MAG: isoaspartyl peptidase/L-asparaginase [Bacteroidota bacterium]